MRLDSYLVETGLFKSRGRAKRAVEDGKVKLNGIVCIKPSKNITTEDVVEAEDGLDMPKGYFKLKAIQERIPILSEGDYVLDLGSSAGGFLMFAAENIGADGHVHGIEFSKDFRTELGKLAFENENITVAFGDVFTLPFENIVTEKNSRDGKFDVLLNDMTLEPTDSIAALERMTALLREGGRLLQVIKIPKNRSKASILRKIEDFGFTVEDVIEPERQETYIIARKNESGNENYEEECFIDENGIEYDLRKETSSEGIDITDMHFEGEDEE
jgi:Predicted rRNA methylase